MTASKVLGSGQDRRLRIEILLLDIAIAVALVVVAAVAFRLISRELASGILGSIVIAAATGVRKLHFVARVLLIFVGLSMFAIGGWLDLEGWRFLPRRPLSGSP